jgi:RNA polymerase subunit RPABC4/transcription elongation factor Spt4
LEEEALLQDLEERLVCPGCKRKIQPDFIICPDCHTRLKKSCPHCRRLLHLKWNVCPYCGAGPTSRPEQFAPASESEPKVESTQV